MRTRPTDSGAEVDVVGRVHDHGRTVIDAELQRLSRRVPSSSPADLAVIDAELEDLAESLILERLRHAPPNLAPLLPRLFSSPRPVKGPS
jgi:hypothetical protein